MDRAPSPLRDATPSRGNRMRPGRRRRAAPISGLLALALLAAACGANSGELARATSEPRTSATGSASSVDWGQCKSTVARLAGLQCGSLEVPLDPAKPDGETISLELARARSTGKGKRLGSIVMNPGGPGGSGIEAVANFSPLVPSELRDHFDLVGWDPRGVGESSPVVCLDDSQKDAQIQGDLSPDTQAEWDKAVADQAQMRKGCEDRNAAMVKHMSTADVAADLDRIRAALGDEQLTYLGYSYGTEIGAVYATLFPDKVRALVLDGAVAPDGTAEAESTTQAKGFESTYQSFLAACDASASCALSGGAADKVAAVRARLDTTPADVTSQSGTRQLGRDLFDIGLATALYDTSLWGVAADAIAGIDSGGAAVLLALADRQIGRKPDGTWDNTSDSKTMVDCNDSRERPTAAKAIEEGKQVASASPTFGDTFATGLLECVGWPQGANPVPKITGKGSKPILVIGTVGDPATPYEWAQQMTHALESATLLTWEGSGHTAFLRAGDCIDNAVTRYFVDLQLPAEGTRCPATPTGDGAPDFTGIRTTISDQLKEAGVPTNVATCILDNAESELGPSGLDLLIIQNDVEEQTKLFSRLATKCMAGG